MTILITEPHNDELKNLRNIHLKRYSNYIFLFI